MTKNKVVVTGGAGFIGRHIVDELLKGDWEILVLDDLSNPESYVVEDPNIEFRKVDLTNPISTQRHFKDQNYIIHCAAKIGGIGHFHKNPQAMINDNCLINGTVLNAASRCQTLKRFVYLSSSMVYEGSNMFPHREEHISSGQPPFTAYGRSKLVGNWMVEATHKQTDMEYSIVIPFNAYGIGEEPRITESGELDVGYAHVIPDLMYKMLNSKDGTIQILGDGNQTRCFTHVKDIARGIVDVMVDRRGRNRIYNIGTTEETSVLELIELIQDVSVGKLKVSDIEPIDPFENDVQKRVPDTTRITEEIGWEPEIDLKDGLREIYNHYVEK